MNTPHLTLLGAAVLDDGAGPVAGAVARRHPLALLALLSTARSRTVSRGKLVGLLWPEAAEKTARNRLNTSVHLVRRRLDGTILISVGDDLRLNRDAVECDVWQFEAAVDAGEHERAVKLYGGAFLDGFQLGGSAGFEKRIERTRDRLRRIYLGELEELAEAAESRGEPGVAADWWRNRANADRYDSRVTLRLMRALEAAGSRASAIRVARLHGRLLEHEFGTEPPAEVRRLAQRLRSSTSSDARGTGSATSETGSGAGEKKTGDESSREPAPAVSTDGGSDVPPPGDPPEKVSTGGEEGDGHGAGRRLRVRVGTGVLLLLVAVLLAALALVGGRTAETDPRPSVAVLPFETLGAEEPTPFAAGLHSDLLTRLANVPGLTVISRTSVLRFRSTARSTSEIARKLGVRWVVEGGVQRVGDEVRVNAQLIDATTDAHEWAENYQRELTARNLFAIQTELTEKITRSLEARLTRREEARIERLPTEDLGAYRFYVQGRTYLDQRTEAGMRRALTLFRRALARDSGYARAWVGVADALTLLADYGYAPADSALPPARRAAERALDLAPRSGAAHASLALLHSEGGRGAAALRELRTAVESRPGYAEAHSWLGWIHPLLGHPEEGLASARRAAELNPLSPEAATNVALGYLITGDAESALTASRRAGALQPAFPSARLLEAAALYQLGRLDEANRVLRGLEVPWARSAPAGLRALIHVARGDTASARVTLRRIGQGGESAFYVGLTRAALGADDTALSLFEQIDGWGRSPHLAWPNLSLRYLFPQVLGPLRDEARYRVLLSEITRAWGMDPDAEPGVPFGRTAGP